MTTYKITSAAGVDMGTYDGATPAAPMLWLVSEGEATPAGDRTDVDDPDCQVLVYAADEASAIALADAYDRREIQPDNVMVDGRAVAALRDYAR